jgi:hypothetical protein
MLDMNTSRENEEILKYVIVSANIFLADDVQKSSLVNISMILGSVIHIGTLVLLVILIRKNLFELVNVKEKPGLFNNISFLTLTILWIIEMVILLLLSSHYNQTVDFLGDDHKLSIGIGFYFVIIISIGLIIWNIFFRTKNKRLENQINS